MRTVAAKVMLMAIVAGGTIGVLAGPASAHATLQRSSPAAGSALGSGAPPTRVTLTFDESVVISSKSIELFDRRSRAVRTGPVRHGTNDTTIVARLPELADGNYVVTWRVVSADSHPIQGAFSFGVGVAASNTADAQGLLARRATSQTVGVVFGAERALGFLSVLVLAGGLAFVSWCWPEGRHRRDVSALLIGAFVVVVGSSLLGIGLQAAYTSGGGLGSALDRARIGDVLNTHFGTASVARAGLAVLLVALFWLRGRLRAPAARLASDAAFVVAALASCGTFTYAGHGETGRWAPLGSVADLSHLGAAALWLGGLAVLAVGLRDPFRLLGAARATERFSRLALPAIFVLALSGTVQGIRQVGTWYALWHTTYGRLLVAKVTVVGALLVAAYASREVLRLRVAPAVRARLAPGADRLEAEPRDARELRNGIWVEVALAVVILVITAALVNSQPAREAAASTPRTFAASLPADQMRFDVAVQPALPGNDTIVVTPRPASPKAGSVLQLDARLSLPGRVAPIPLTFAPLTGGRYAANALVPFAGSWRLEVRCLRTQVDESVATTTIRFG